MAAYLPLARPFEAFFFSLSLSVHFTSDTVLEPTRNYRETRQRQCSGAISSVISLLWASTHQREYQAVSKSQPLLPQAIILNPLTFTSQPLTNGSVCACVRVCLSVCNREWVRRRMRFLTEGGRKKREGKRRREKQDPAPNSMEGERSQFSLAAEGRLQQLVGPEAAVASPLPLIPGFMEKGCRPRRQIKTSFTVRADGCEWERARRQMVVK